MLHVGAMPVCVARSLVSVPAKRMESSQAIVQEGYALALYPLDSEAPLLGAHVSAQAAPLSAASSLDEVSTVSLSPGFLGAVGSGGPADAPGGSQPPSQETASQLLANMSPHKAAPGPDSRLPSQPSGSPHPRL